MAEAPGLKSGGLEVRGLCKHFGGVLAVKDLSFSVQPGECVAIIGPNGAGKSTTFACVAGQQVPGAGQVLWHGERVDRLAPAQRLARGIARTFQVAQTFESLTVLQNVQLLLPGTPVMNPFAVLDDLPTEPAMALLRCVGLDALSQSDARSLAYGARKRLELAMALAGRPGLLLLDEPAAGLAAPERAALMQLVHSLARGTTGSAPLAVLYTEHNMDAVFGVADRVLVIMEGRLITSGTAAEVSANDLVRSRYLGQSFRHVDKDVHA